MSETFIDFEILPAAKGIRKRYKWGKVEIYNTSLKDCFSDDELTTVIQKLNALPTTSLSAAQKLILTAIIARRAAK